MNHCITTIDILITLALSIYLAIVTIIAGVAVVLAKYWAGKP